ncbi:N-acetylmuramidase domain-containing protein [Aureimonas frigidaquae]|uniref:N-acetylmuramidase domain-containing protein n=1 Tax=Aureimonas frigidaquae TaxID=424757 RepID=UPI00178CDCAA|nr:N-acetylmuramidase domain-containing protein [Aureimonas frigidaquae]
MAIDSVFVFARLARAFFCPEASMNFVGTGRRLEQGDVGNAARLINVPTAALLAVIEIEARGSGFDAQRRPIILYEPHRFYVELGAGAKRDRAVKEGLAYRAWGTKPYPAGSSAQYARLAAAVAIDRDAALKSCSWGLPQILGANHCDSGFPAPVPMVEAFMQGERQQLEAMCTLIKAWRLDRAMRQFGEAGLPGEHAFAKRWNGSAYASHGYHTRLRTAFLKHSGDKDMPLATSAVLRSGSKGEAVRSLQSDLLALGFDPGPVDGRYGPKTVEAVRAAQVALSLSADGIAGPATKAALAAALASKDVDPGHGEQWPEREAASPGAEPTPAPPNPGSEPQTRPLEPAPQARTHHDIIADLRRLADELETLEN